MKRIALITLLLCLGVLGIAQQATKPQWTKVLSDKPATFQTELISSTENSIKVNVQVPGFFTTNVNTPNGEAKVITLPKSVSTANAGEPDMPMTGIPVMIGDKARMNVRVLSAQYTDFEGIEVAPSKGDFPRSIDPATVPYTYGECYQQDAFFPASSVELYEPYIIRDFRGQNIAVYPFAYNPVTKTLRVYHDMTIEMYKVDDKGANVIESRRSNVVKVDPDFKSVYQRHFINYEAGTAKYTPVDEEGDLLIICYDNFISSMTDFVNWKKTRGLNTTIVGTSTAGNSYSAIYNYIKSQYNANNNLTHVLLVGDVAQIPGYTYSGASGYEGKGDNPYGQIVGSDVYNDLFIGRFSAQNAAQVNTQVQRVITYERDLTTSATWLKKADGVSRQEYGSGHNGEDDYEHMDLIRTDLLNYGYSTVYQDYENISGYTGTASSISSHINGGVGIVNYTNHGDNQMWAVADYSNVQVNALTNENKLPFIWSVACLVGKYDNTETDYGSGTTVGQTNDCFAEAWMHATNSSMTQPTGAIGALMSYISQPWIPPMWGQDECVDILVESYDSNIKHTWGGVSINGIMGIFDNYSTSTAQALGTYQAWVLYGDPSMMLRTKTPQAMTVTHDETIINVATSFSVSVSNGNGSLATLTDADHNIIGTATVSNGSATISIDEELTVNEELTLCVFGYNKVTYLGTVTVVGGTTYTINATASPSAGGTVSGAGTYYGSTSCTLTATANHGYEFTSWKKGSTVVSTNPTYTFTVSASTAGSYTANFTQLTLHTLSCPEIEHGTVTISPTTAYKGDTITLTPHPDDGFCFQEWIVTTNGKETITVVDNQFIMPDDDVTVVGVFVAVQVGEVIIGSGSSTLANLPTNVKYKYTTSQQIYTASEVGEAGSITAISFKYNGYATSGARDLDIYITHTTSSTLSTWVAVNANTKVYSGTQTFTESGWHTITLDTPFEYNGTSNIMITVDDNTGEGSGSGKAFYVYSTGSKRAIYKQSDNYNVTPTSPQTSSSYNPFTTTNNNQLKIIKMVPDSEGYLSVSPSSLTDFATIVGTPSEAQSVTVTANNLQDDLTITAPNGFELSASQSGSYSSTLTLTPTSGSIQQMIYVRLSANATQGTYSGNITFVSNDTNANVSVAGEVTQGMHWTAEGSQYASNMSVYAIVQIEGMEQRSEQLEVGGFADDECRGSEKALYCPPVDRYILPMLLYGDNGDEISFKLYDHEQDLESVLTCTTVLSFNEEGYGSITNPVILNFTSQSTSTVTQTCELDAGWHWWSTYIEMSEINGLESLKQQLGSSARMIKSSNDFISYHDGNWGGSLSEINNESCFMILIADDVTVEITGAETVPENHPITIKNGWNWIGYPCSQAMTLDEAFNNFTPSENDMIKSGKDYATYNSGSWNGSLDTLEPGQGYMYLSKKSETQTLTLPSSKLAKH